MTFRVRIALVISLLLAAVVNLTSVDGGLGHGSPFGQPTKSRIEFAQTRASLARDTARRFSSACSRISATAAWLRSAASDLQIRTSPARAAAPRTASSFPPHWGSLHLNV